jgi:glutaredoxin
MESITIYPKNEKQKVLLKSLLKEMNVQFKTRKITDNTLLTEDEFYAKIDKSVQQAENGESKLLSEERQKEFLGL